MTKFVDLEVFTFIFLPLVREVWLQQPNRRTYTFCGDVWDARYPWLAEVKYSRTDKWYDFKYHQNRHGVLVTNRAVLTRAQDLDGYPDTSGSPKDMVPIAKNFEQCHQRKALGVTACVYVSIRRPQREGYVDGPYCGQNIIVSHVITHPKYGKSAHIKNLFIKGPDNSFRDHMRNIKFPFAIAALAEGIITTDPHQPFVPTAILPRDPLDFLYWLRRVDTIGPESKYCEYPTYDKIEHDQWYSPYSKTPETLMRLREREYRDSPNVLCPDDWGQKKKGFEGTKAPLLGRPRDKEFQKICNESILENILPYTFLMWRGTYGTFDEVYEHPKGYWQSRKTDSDDRLGSPIVCDGVLLGITSTWANRGTGRRDVYIGTTLMRVYGWLIRHMLNNTERAYHRAQDDSAFFGLYYKFKKRGYKKRVYDQDIFELSINEPYLHFAGSPKICGSLMGHWIFLMSLVVFYF